MTWVKGILAKARNHITYLKKVTKFSIQYKNILAPNALTWDQIQKWQKKQRKAEMQKKFYALLLILKLDYILKCNRADLEQ